MTAGVVAGGVPELRRSRRSFRTTQHGHLIVVTTPGTDPDLWEQYLAGATASYGAYAVEHALELDQVADGRSTTMLFVALAPDGSVRGGMRSQGPYTRPEESQALSAFEGRPDRSRVRSMIEQRLPSGLVEPKGLWVGRGFAGRRELVSSFSRTPVHAATMMGARYVVGLTGEHTETLWADSGAVAPELAVLDFPDARYRTRLIFWDRWAHPSWVTDTTRRAYDAETAQLIGSLVPAPRRSA